MSHITDDVPASRGSLTVRIKGHLPELQPALAKVANFILDHPDQVAGMTINSLANSVNVSETTVVRFCREVGLRGYSQLRLGLAKEAGARLEASERFDGSTDINAGDSLIETVKKIAYADAKSVEDTASSLSLSSLEVAITSVAAASRTDIYGVGASGLVAMDLQQKLHRIGLVSFSFTDPHQASVSAALLTPDAVAIAISHSGNTTDTIDALAEAKQQGASTIAITNSPKSPLAELADVVLTTAAMETTYRSAATGSRLAQLTVVDCLFVGVAQLRFDASMAALDETRRAVSAKRFNLENDQTQR